jgi:hypothetical protein
MAFQWVGHATGFEDMINLKRLLAENLKRRRAWDSIYRMSE